MATTMSGIAPLGWISIIRMGLVQASLGAVVVLTKSVLNRVMVVELALPAMLPGARVALSIKRRGFAPFCACCPARPTAGPRLIQTLGSRNRPAVNTRVNWHDRSTTWIQTLLVVTPKS